MWGRACAGRRISTLSSCSQKELDLFAGLVYVAARPPRARNENIVVFMLEFQSDDELIKK